MISVTHNTKHRIRDGNNVQKDKPSGAQAPALLASEYPYFTLFFLFLFLHLSYLSMCLSYLSSNSKTAQAPPPLLTSLVTATS